MIYTLWHDLSLHGVVVDRVFDRNDALVVTSVLQIIHAEPESRTAVINYLLQ